MKHEFEKEGDMMEQMIEAAGLQCASSRHDAMRDVALMSETAMFQRFRGIWILPMRDGVIPG